MRRSASRNLNGLLVGHKPIHYGGECSVQIILRRWTTTWFRYFLTDRPYISFNFSDYDGIFAVLLPISCWAWRVGDLEWCRTIFGEFNSHIAAIHEKTWRRFLKHNKIFSHNLSTYSSSSFLIYLFKKDSWKSTTSSTIIKAVRNTHISLVHQPSRPAHIFAVLSTPPTSNSRAITTTRAKKEASSQKLSPNSIPLRLFSAQLTPPHKYNHHNECTSS